MSCRSSYVIPVKLFCEPCFGKPDVASTVYFMILVNEQWFGEPEMCPSLFTWRSQSICSLFMRAIFSGHFCFQIWSNYLSSFDVVPLKSDRYVIDVFVSHVILPLRRNASFSINMSNSFGLVWLVHNTSECYGDRGRNKLAFPQVLRGSCITAEKQWLQAISIPKNERKKEKHRGLTYHVHVYWLMESLSSCQLLWK